MAAEAVSPVLVLRLQPDPSVIPVCVADMRSVGKTQALIHRTL